jgi:hypothetical protein
MCFHDAPRDVKAEAQASPVVLTDLPESLEDGSQGALGYAGARVADAEAKLLSDALASEGDFAALRGEFDRIREEVAEHLKHTVVVEFFREGVAQRSRFSEKSPWLTQPL